MPRTRKPQTTSMASRVNGTGRVANTTTSFNKEPVVYRFWGSRQHPSCKAPTSSVTVDAPLHVQIVGDNVYHVTISMDEVKSRIESFENLDLSNSTITLGEVEWPVTFSWDVTVENGSLNATTWNITSIVSTDITTNALNATDIATVDFNASGNASVDWTLTVDWATILNNGATITWATTITGKATITEVETPTATITNGIVTTLNSTTSTIGNLTVNNDAIVAWDLSVAWDTNVKDLTVDGDETVTGNETITGNLEVTWESTFTGKVTAWDILSNWNTTLNNLAVTWNEVVNGTSTVQWATVLNNTLTVAWASTLGGAATVAGNLSVGGNQLVTWTSTVTGDTVLNGTLSVASDLSVGGDATITDDLTVNGNTSLKSLETSGSTDIGWTLRVDGAINGWNGLTVTWQVESDTIRTKEAVVNEVRVQEGLYLSEWAEAPAFILQSEKNQPNGVVALDSEGKVSSDYLPDVYTTAIVKIGTGIFNNTDTVVITDADITYDSYVHISNYTDIVWDTTEVVNPWQITVVSNQVETGSFKYIVVNPLSA